MENRKTPASLIALSGTLAALAVVILCFGVLIPGTGYICPVIAMMMTEVVLKTCGGRIAWTWYACVAILSALMSPDKEAAAVFLFLGYYPIVKPRLEGKKLPWLWKGLLFNSAVVVMSWLLTKLLGLPLVEEGLAHMKYLLLAVMLILGNLTFFLADRLLTVLPEKLRRG